MSLHLEIVTPEKSVYSQAADSVVVPTAMGEIGILPGHMPLLAVVEAGELRVTRNGKVEHLAVDAGFLELSADHLSILTEAAVDIADIDVSAVEEAQKRAEKALEEAKDKMD